MTDQTTSPLFTVFIPCFNRAYALPRTLESVSGQTFRDFEILIVDDGSTDNTKELIQEWQSRHRIPLRYIYQENQGKHSAYNLAAKEAQGELLVLLDSDDIMLPDALCILAENWHAITPELRVEFAGVEGLCADSQGRLHGDLFPDDVIDSNYLEITQRFGVKGEKRHAIRTDVLQQFPYPIVPGERHIRPSYVWKRIAHHYKFRYINKVIQVVDFLPDGLTRNAMARRLKNPRGLYLYWLDDLNNHQQYSNPTKRRYAGSQVIRYGLLCGINLGRQWKEVTKRWAWLTGFPRGITDHITDRFKRKRILTP
jgi:glycosyltransferase involved in cell wall biosynthesis